MKKIHVLYYDREYTTPNELWDLRVDLASRSNKEDEWIFIPKDYNYEYWGDSGKQEIIEYLEQLIEKIKESD